MQSLVIILRTLSVNKTSKSLLLIFLFLLSSATFALAQAGSAVTKKYLIEFTDKNNSPYSIQNPTEFLSTRAIERRQRQNIPITSSDFPVNPDYLQGLKSFTLDIIHTSKWLNMALVLADEAIMERIKRLKFVKSVTYVGENSGPRLILRRSGKSRDESPAGEKTEDEYGFAEFQNTSINVNSLHEQNYRGKGILIAVLDGGFSNADIMPFFDKVRSEKRFYKHKDFVEGDDYVFETSSHGSQVLSVMAANIPNVLVGSAPDASYVCLKTEDNSGEYRAEECNWISALEYADSLGADIINSSLGYTTFSDASMNYSYKNLDGKTSIATQAAEFAFTKGMIVVNSVGNEGNTPWKYLDVPADGKNVLAVGATDEAGYKTKFSSYGPTPDGRIKPDVSALGKNISVASIYGTKVKSTKGTSFSSPLVAGAIASLWQAVPNRTNAEIIQAIKLSADRAARPNNELGYGIPDFGLALELLR